MISVYINLLPDVPYIPLLYPNLGVQKRETILFLNNAFADLNHPFVQLTESPEEAGYILLPHNYSSLKGKEDYIANQAQLAHNLGKKLIVFWHGDSDSPVPYENTIIFRTNQYRSSLRDNEIIMPAYAEDLLEGELSVRSKHTGKPIVGFCGWAGYKNCKNRIGTLLQNSLIEAKRFFGVQNLGARVKGISFRMKMINHLQQSALVEPNFIIRNSYSGHSATIKIDPQQARKEYIENMLHSDYALIIKGDGNYSYRFYEALSLGRIPVLLDTDCVLPLEDIIDYDEFILRVPYQDLYRIDQYIAQHYQAASSEEFEGMQRRGREVFEEHLRVDRFLQYIAENVL